MLQLVNVEAWAPEVVLPVISGQEALRVAISGEARSAGCGGPTNPACRIEGRVRRAEWSLLTLLQRSDFVAEVTDVVIVCLFDSPEQARHFAPERRNIHAHAGFPALGVVGHLKTLALESGALLQLQTGEHQATRQPDTSMISSPSSFANAPGGRFSRRASAPSLGRRERTPLIAVTIGRRQERCA